MTGAVFLPEPPFVPPIKAIKWHGNLVIPYSPSCSVGGSGIKVFLGPDGQGPKAGQLHRNPDLAATFRKLAQEGAQKGVSATLGLCAAFCKKLCRSPANKL